MGQGHNLWWGLCSRRKYKLEDIMGKPESGWEGELEVGTSSTPTQRKGKQPIMWSPCKQPDASIILPCIPEGVQATPSLLGCIERIRYTNHDVSDTKKIPRICAAGVYGEPGNMAVRRSSVATKAMGGRFRKHRDP
jgi:hypothetical protein